MLRGLAVTGGVITSAGIVLAGTFLVLGVLPLVALTEIGFVVALGVLLDTTLVRSVLVPALVLDLGATNLVALTHPPRIPTLAPLTTAHLVCPEPRGDIAGHARPIPDDQVESDAVKSKATLILSYLAANMPAVRNGNVGDRIRDNPPSRAS